MSEFKEGMKIEFTAAHESSNTGPVTINGQKLIEVPRWVQDQLQIGDRLGWRGSADCPEWFINDQPVSQPQGDA